MCDDWTCFNFETLKDVPITSGVYFLMNGIELVYIGQTNNLRSRMGQHHSNWNSLINHSTLL